MAATWAGTPKIRGPSDPVRMVLLTVCLSGVQLVWGIEMAYCTPYLLSLGLTKSLMSLVWNIGPLSGLITQPIVGVIADRSRSRFGRRRPVMVVGAAATAIALISLGWAKEIVGLFFSPGETANTCTILLAILSIYLVDFAINAVQACCRALIVDTLPAPQQQHGNAWASRMVAVGNIAGYFAGTIDLVSIFGASIGDTQFKQLMILASILLMSCILITCFSVEERVLITRRESDKGSGVLQVFALIWKTMWHLPTGIWDMCVVLFWAWIGWFPFMVYSTTFVAEVLKRYDTAARESLETSDDVLGDIARVGSMALVLFSCVSLAASVLLPWVVDSPESRKHVKKHLVPTNFLEQFSQKVAPYKPNLTDTWIFGHITYAVLMFITIFIGRVSSATFCVAFSGVSWALMTWAPFSIVGEEINKLSEPSGTIHRSHGGPYDPVTQREFDHDVQEMETIRASISTDATPMVVDPEAQSHEPSDLAGVYLGIMNVFSCLPQFVSSFISFVVFSILEPGKSPEFSEGGGSEAPTYGINAIAVCMGIGGIATLVAAHFTTRFRDR
ncbi:major facilitator superfamily domain-containing protein [Tuber borchii]|uniref:Major facilitator superfamily domain-containing protein n=1 Tax=Tuber borchii TaxID=42251 RepID=A0A2T7A432_TUBBO|nr:major facilitator superfamily domain-containing protein [Tuber borchii]